MDNEMVSRIAGMGEQSARFHDPSLYFKDSDKAKTAVEVNFKGDDGQDVSKLIEKNPNKFKGKNLKNAFGGLAKKILNNK
jgi:predicted secreted protein